MSNIVFIIIIWLKVNLVLFSIAGAMQWALPHPPPPIKQNRTVELVYPYTTIIRWLYSFEYMSFLKLRSLNASLKSCWSLSLYGCLLLLFDSFIQRVRIYCCSKMRCFVASFLTAPLHFPSHNINNYFDSCLPTSVWVQ